MDAAALVENAAFGGLDQADEHLHRGALAGAIRPEASQSLARPDLEAYAADGGRVVVVLGERTGFEHFPLRRLDTGGEGQVAG